MKHIKTLIVILVIGLLAGCSTSQMAKPSTSHVIDISATGTKFGITENPATQLYECGITRFNIDFHSVPIIWATNRDGQVYCVIPETVFSHEVQGRNSTFGGAGVTITLATGTNAVNTLLGGQHKPINETTSAVK